MTRRPSPTSRHMSVKKETIPTPLLSLWGNIVCFQSLSKRGLSLCHTVHRDDYRLGIPCTTILNKAVAMKGLTLSLLHLHF